MQAVSHRQSQPMVPAEGAQKLAIEKFADGAIACLSLPERSTRASMARSSARRRAAIRSSSISVA